MPGERGFKKCDERFDFWLKLHVKSSSKGNYKIAAFTCNRARKALSDKYACLKGYNQCANDQ